MNFFLGLDFFFIFRGKTFFKNEVSVLGRYQDRYEVKIRSIFSAL